jgi:hypothetical protein
MIAEKRVFKKIFYYNILKIDLIEDILEKDLFDKEMWDVDLKEFLDLSPKEGMWSPYGDWIEDFEEYTYNLERKKFILYYETTDPAIIAFETKNEYDTFLDIIKVFKEENKIYLKDEILELFEPYRKEFLSKKGG